MRHKESFEQQAIFHWALFFESKYPELECMYAVPNGGYRNKATAAILKAEGAKAGVSDICLPVPRGGYGSLYIELKAPDAANKKGTPEQQEWIRKMKKHGNYACICVGAEKAIEIIERYLQGAL